jgi:hypothetical protein
MLVCIVMCVVFINDTTDLYLAIVDLRLIKE